MTESIINGEMKVRVPDGFEIMDAETLKEAYMDDNPDRWGIRDRERHMIISVFYHRSSPALLTLPMSKVRGFLLPADISSAGQFISDRPQCKVRVCHYPS